MMTFKPIKWLVLPTPPLFDAPLGRIPLEFRDETYPVKTREMGLTYGVNVIILINRFLTDPPV